MGSVKISNRDGRIVFHVGKELPEEGSDFLIVPGKQNAQGRGVYATDAAPQMKYAGGEHYQKAVERIPIFLLPAQGSWARAVLKQKDNTVVYHSDGKMLLMKGLRSVDSVLGGQPVRYYFSSDIDLIDEPPMQDRSDSLISRLRDGRATQREVLSEADRLGCRRVSMDVGRIEEKIREAAEQGRIPVEIFAEMSRERLGSEPVDGRRLGARR